MVTHNLNTAIIIAGGKGTRMHPVTGDRLPKALLPIDGRPVIVRQLDLLQRYAYKRCIISSGHLAAELKHALGERHEDIALDYAIEPTPLGTAGGLALIADSLPDHFLVLYGDVACWFDLAAFAAAHHRFRSDATLVVHPNDHPFDSDFVEADEHGIISRLLPKSERPPGDYANLVSAAAYCLSRAALRHILPATKQDFVKDVFPRMLAAGERLLAYRTTEYLKDSGTPDRIEQVDAAYRAGMHEKRLRGQPRSAVFLDRDGVINIERDHLKRADDFQLIDGSAAAIRKLNKAGQLVVVVTNQPGLAKGFFSASDLAAIHRRMETALGAEGAYVDAIYHCPHHPESGFDGEITALKIPCSCRKPSPGMLYRAAHDLTIDLSRSIMIGDSYRDIDAAHRAGVMPLAVRTGYGHKQVPSARHEWAMFDDLAEATEWLTREDTQLDAYVDQLSAAPPGTTPLGTDAPPQLVLIGGIARAGKTSLAAALAWRLRQRGKRALAVSLDEWITPLNLRPAGNTHDPATQTAESMARHFGLAEAHHALQTLSQGWPIISPGYEPLSRLQAAPRCYDPRGSHVILADGVMALSPQLTDLPALRIYVHADESVLVTRFTRYYAWKGLAQQQINTLLQQRRSQEWPHVQQTRANANTIYPSP